MNIKERMLLREKFYSPFATKDKESIRLIPIEEDIRPNFFRDIDRIIHSTSYTRYMDKTQVFSLKDNDNISKRMVHVQLVSKIARTIGRALSLNEDLIEAAALGHDLGHVPFGQHRAHRVGQGGDGAEPGDHAGDALLGELQPVKHGATARVR